VKEHGAEGKEQREIQLADCSGQQAAVVRGWRSGPAGLEVGGKTKESVVRCQWSVAQIIQAVKAQGARSQKPVASMDEHSLCFCLLDSGF
jgi:hypothetical protein